MIINIRYISNNFISNILLISAETAFTYIVHMYVYISILQIMRRPTSTVMEKFSGTILDFIAANELYTLIPIYEGLFQLTGYK